MVAISPTSPVTARINRMQFSTSFLILTNLVIFQLAYLNGQYSFPGPVPLTAEFLSMLETDEHRGIGIPRALSHSHAIPLGEAVPLPSVRTENATREAMYGGKGDKPHLGGFVDVDMHGVSPATWTYMLETIGVKSVIDVGCGRGISTSWFIMHGVDALCVEGSHDAKERSMLPDPETQMVEHDFSRGPWWPKMTYDAAWCVEFLEHVSHRSTRLAFPLDSPASSLLTRSFDTQVGRNFHKNYLPTFRKAAIIFVTHSMWGGWHHVEVHDADWWITKFELYGFVYSPILTESVRDRARSERTNRTTINGAKDGKYNAQHVWLHMLVFLNPEVASLPHHAHLMAEAGCYKDKSLDGYGRRVIIHRECGTGRNSEHETRLPYEFMPIRIEPSEKKIIEWEEWVNKHIDVQVR